MSKMIVDFSDQITRRVYLFNLIRLVGSVARMGIDSFCGLIGSFETEGGKDLFYLI